MFYMEGHYVFMFHMSFMLLFLCNFVHFLLSSLLTRGLAGIQPVDVPGIENVSFHLYFSS